MIYPKFLDKGSTIGVPAPSAGAGDLPRQNRFNNAKKYIESIGYNLVLSENLMKCERARSAPAKKRAEEINSMFKDKNIDFVLCAAGGEFLVETLPFINFNLIKDNPKFVAGFSDPTGILYPITTKYDIATIYGHNFSSFGIEEICEPEKNFLSIATGNLITQHSFEMYEKEGLERITGLEGYNFTEKVYWNTLDDKPVSIKGRIIGGCFDLISELAGTKYDGINEFNEKYKDDGIIWYFDNCEITMEETIRTLWKFNELGYFKYTKGVIFGRFGVNKSYFDYDVKTCLQDSALGSLGIPIVYDADISHKDPCLTIINGSIATIDVKEGKATISFELI